MYVSGINVSHMCVGAYREQRVGRIPLELELQVVVSYSGPLASTVNCRTIFPAPVISFNTLLPQLSSKVYVIKTNNLWNLHSGRGELTVKLSSDFHTYTITQTYRQRHTHIINKIILKKGPVSCLCR